MTGYKTPNLAWTKTNIVAVRVSVTNHKDFYRVGETSGRNGSDRVFLLFLIFTIFVRVKYEEYVVRFQRSLISYIFVGFTNYTVESPSCSRLVCTGYNFSTIVANQENSLFQIW